MKKFVLIVMLFAFLAPSAFAQKTRFGQGLPKARAGVAYPIKIHISGVHLRSNCTGSSLGPSYASCMNVVYADATMNGQHVEFAGEWLWTRDPGSAPVTIGDYQARRVKRTKGAGNNLLGERYEFLFPDRTVWPASVTGISE